MTRRVLALTILFLLLLPAGAVTGTTSTKHVFENVPPAILNWVSPLPLTNDNCPPVTSKWNQPRDVGTNPHQGIDVSAVLGTAVYAVWDGWLTHYSDGVSLQLNTSPTYYVHYYHLTTRNVPGYYTKGASIGTSGYPSGPHLHFGGTTDNSSSPKWYRNEVNYRWNSKWRSGKDVDSYSWATWDGGRVAGITAYFLTGGNPIVPAEVRIFHRKAGTSTWTNGGLMPHQGDHKYTYDFTGQYPSGTEIDWLVRIQRGGLGSTYSYCWAPSQYERPDPNPNNVTYKYPYYRNRLQ